LLLLLYCQGLLLQCLDGITADCQAAARGAASRYVTLLAQVSLLLLLLPLLQCQGGIRADCQEAA
jgi:hypothetical protein